MGSWRRAAWQAGLALAIAGAGGAARADPPPASDAPASSASASDQRITDAISAEHDLVAGSGAPAQCPGGDDNALDSAGAIVVCARDRSARWRVPSTAESDPRSPDALHTGARVAPNVGSGPDCSAPGAHCRRFGYAPPPIYYIDTTKLPKPAPGTDADRIANGEEPAP